MTEVHSTDCELAELAFPGEMRPRRGLGTNSQLLAKGGGAGRLPEHSLEAQPAVLLWALSPASPLCLPVQRKNADLRSETPTSGPRAPGCFLSLPSVVSCDHEGSSLWRTWSMVLSDFLFPALAPLLESCLLPGMPGFHAFPGRRHSQV